MTDIYQPYRDMLDGKYVPIYADQPYPGRYKMKRTGTYVPVLINIDTSGAMRARITSADKGKDEIVDAVSVWTYCAKTPVSKADFDAYHETGKWPDMPIESPRGNMPSDPFEALMAEIGDKTAQAEELLAKGDAQTEREANLARNIQKQLLALISRADDLHTAEKEPALQEGRRIDAKFQFRKAVKSVADRLRGAFESFMKKEEDRLKAEATARYEAERRVVESARKAVAEAQAKKLRDDPIAALTSEPVPLPDLPPPPEPVKVQVGGGYGSKAGLKSKWRGEVDDYGAAASYFIAHPDMKALIEKLASRTIDAAKGAIVIPGVRNIEDRKAA